MGHPDCRLLFRLPTSRTSLRTQGGACCTHAEWRGGAECGEEACGEARAPVLMPPGFALLTVSVSVTEESSESAYSANPEAERHCETDPPGRGEGVSAGRLATMGFPEGWVG